GDLEGVERIEDEDDRRCAAEDLERLPYHVDREVARAEQRAGALGRLVQEVPDTDRRRQGAHELHLPQDLLPDRQEMVGAIAVHSQWKGPAADEVATRNDG